MTYSLTFEDRQIPTNEEGYLLDPGDWSEDLARFLAKADGIELGEDHWDIIEIYRRYFLDLAVTPPVRVMIRELREKPGREDINSQWLHELFTEPPARQASRYGGLPKPIRCI